MYFSSVCVHVTGWIIACMRTCYLSVDMNSRVVVVLVQRVALTKPKPEQALSVVTDADRQTEDMMKVSISQSNILNWNILLQGFCKACQVPKQDLTEVSPLPHFQRIHISIMLTKLGEYFNCCCSHQNLAAVFSVLSADE